MITREHMLELAREVVSSKAFKTAQVTYFEELKRGWWLAACTKCDWLGLSKDMVLSEHGVGHNKYFQHHCPKCDAAAFDPKQALEDPIYEFNDF